MPTSQELSGTWRVTGFQEWSEGGEHRPLGDAPIGYAVFDRTAGLFIQLSRSPAESGSPKDIADSFIAYFGSFMLDGNRLTIITETGNAAHDVSEN